MKKLFYILVFSMFFASCSCTSGLYYRQAIPGKNNCSYKKELARDNVKNVFNHGDRNYRYTRRSKTNKKENVKILTMKNR